MTTDPDARAAGAGRTGAREAGARRADAREADDAPASRASRVGDEIRAPNAGWSFGGEVASAFEAHIERSVPGYREGHALVADIADFFVHDGSLVYELGCSTGALCRRLAGGRRPRGGGSEGDERGGGRRARIVGIEREPGMVAEARRRCAGHAAIEIVEGDALEVELERCDLVVAYYTAQFVRPSVRQLLFDRVHEALEWGGAFVLFEKVRAPDARFQDLVSTLYTDFKLERGFSEGEIVHKARSLKGVLEPFSSQGNLDLLARAGFVDTMTVWKHLCFEGFLAIK